MKKALLFLGSLSVTINMCSAQVWSAVGNGVDGRVASMVEYNGELYVSGQGFFDTFNQVGIVKWNGTTFEALPGLDMFGIHTIEGMAVHNGYLYVGGVFNSASGLFGSISDNVARWDGSAWSTVGDGFDGAVYALKTYDGDLFAGGMFQESGSTSCSAIARWDGNQWNSLNTTFSPGWSISAMEEYGTELYVVGNFQSWSSYCIARWDGTAWSNLAGNGIQIGLYALAPFNGALAVGGVNYFEACGTPVNGMASWNGISWTSLESYGGWGLYEQLVLSLATYHGELYAGGDFSMMGGNAIKGIARYDGTAWSGVGSGVDSTGVIVDTIGWFPDTMFLYAPHRVNAMLEFQGDLYVGGEFNMIGGVEAHSIAKWTLPVGTSEGMDLSAMRLFPNPACTVVFMDIPKGLAVSSVRVFDGQGRLILQHDGPVNGPLDVSTLLPGQYHVELRSGDRSLHKSLSIVR